MAAQLCPICHSNIEQPNPDWTRDPILTIRGLAGEEYKGVTKIDIKYIKEIQDERKQKEIDTGIPEEERTQFTEITPGKLFFTKKLINELRESTEKILTNGEEVIEEKRRELLNEYFNYNEDGEYIGTYKYGQKVADKEEWTDIDRNIEGYEDQPMMPKKTENLQNIVKIKAINIEDLRHPFHLWRETWDSADDLEVEKILEYGEVYWFGLQSKKYLFDNEETEEIEYYREIDADQKWKFSGAIKNGEWAIGFPGGNANSYAQLKVEIKNPEDKILKLSSEIDCPFHAGYLYYHENVANSSFNCELIEQSPNLKVIRNEKNLHLLIEGLSGSINSEVEWGTVVRWIYWNKLRKDYFEDQQSWSGINVTWNWTEEQLKEFGDSYAEFRIEVRFSDGKTLYYIHTTRDLSDSYDYVFPISLGDLDRDLVSDYVSAYGIQPSSNIKVVTININTILDALSFRRVQQGQYDSYINRIYPTVTLVSRSTASLNIELNDIKFKYQS